MNSNSLRLKIVICLTVAVVITFIAVAAKAIVPAMIAGASSNASQPSDNDIKTPDPAPVISLDPNLSCELSFGSQADDKIVFGATIDDEIFLLCNYGENAVITKLAADLTPLSSATFNGRFSFADLCSEGFVTYLGNKIVTINKNFEIINQSPVYENQNLLSLTNYPDGSCAIYSCGGESGSRIVFRFFRDGKLICERFCQSADDVSVIKVFRIGDVFTAFYQYKSDYFSGCGYAKFSLSGLTAGCINIERADSYTLLDVIPYNQSFVLLTSCVDGVSAMELDENMNRFKSHEIIDRAALKGKLSFDGKNYYAFIGGADKGLMTDFGSNFGNFERITTYSAATEISYEINVSGSLTHLCKSSDGFFITDTNGLFTKKINNGINAEFLIIGSFGAVIAGDGDLSHTTLKSLGGSDVYIAKLN